MENKAINNITKVQSGNLLYSESAKMMQGGKTAGLHRVGDGEEGKSVIGFNVPPPINFDTEEMRGSIQRILSDNIGEYVVIEFLVGTEKIERKQGILYYVGTSYVTLYDNLQNNFIVCDIFSVKFVYFYFPGDRPDFNFNVIAPSEKGTGNEIAKQQGRNVSSKRY